MENPFCLSSDFEDFYESRQKNGYEYGYGDFPPCSDNDGNLYRYSSSTSRLSVHKHLGPNIRDDKDFASKTSLQSNGAYNRGWGQLRRSSLFWWISGSIIIPLLFTIIIISTVVTRRVYFDLPDLIRDVEDTYMDMKANSLALVAKLRAKDATQVTFLALRDLHILSRTANWLLLGGIKQSTSFTEMTSKVEECKAVPRGECEYLKDPLQAVCDCEWLLPSSAKKCSKYDIDTRYLQKQTFFAQSQDCWPNGDRNHTSFPNTSYSAETTAWWSNPLDVPGSSKGQSACGYETTFDRLRTMSALSVVQIPVFNYRANLKKRVDNVASYIAFEADGMFIPYSGCSNPPMYPAHFCSSKRNHAFEIRPELCPDGKCGFDPRCRKWYDTGKKTWEKNKNGGNQLYVTPPYLYGGGTHVAQSATIPLSDNSLSSKKYIGQVLIDFFPQEIIKLLRNRTELSDGGFPILITARNEVSGGDTIVGPTLEGYGSNIGDLVLPHDCEKAEDLACSSNRKGEFDIIVQKMKLGRNGKAVFIRMGENGEEEKVNIAYAPVFGMSFNPINSSDFTRGTIRRKSLIFSLALAETHPGLLRAFGDIKDSLRTPVKVSFLVLLVVMVLAIIVVMLISNYVTVSITVPIAHLLTVIKHINRNCIKDDMPQICGGSKEVSCVHSTFEKLYTVVRFGSSAYFSGDLEKAYKVLVDALVLFQKMKNEKAVGIANNNLGNTMLIMYKAMRSKKLDISSSGMSLKDIILKGLTYFDTSINIGEDAIERINQESGFSLEYLVFMQQLSNRYFNRGVFLLTVCGHAESPDDAEQLGLSDLNIAQDMDVEFIDQSDQEGFEFDEDVRFNLVLGRIRGLLLLRKMSYNFDWNIEGLFQDAFQSLKRATKNQQNSLFREFRPAGQMQQLDATLIEYLVHERNDIEEGARVGIRMFVEDEYLLVDAALIAVHSLIEYVKVSSSAKKMPSNIIRRLEEYKYAFSRLEFSRCEGGIESRGDYVTMETF